MSEWSELVSDWNREIKKDDTKRLSKRLRQDLLEKAKALTESAEKATQEK